MKYLIQSKSGETATLYFRIARSVGGKKVDWWFNSHVSVNVAEWNKSRESVDALEKYKNTDEGGKVIKYLNGIDEAIGLLFGKGEDKVNKIKSEDDKHLIEEAVNDVVFADAIAAEQKREEHRKAKEREEEELRAKEQKQIANYLEQFIEGIVSGKYRHHKNEKYTEGTIIIWKQFQRLFVEYMADPRNGGFPAMTFDDITVGFRDGFANWLDNKYFTVNTREKNCSCFRKLCNHAAEYGMNSNAVSLKVKGHEANDEEQTTATEIYLTADEITALYNMELIGDERMARDIFLVGYFSCQRASDYLFFERENFTQTDNGIWVIKGVQQKTKRRYYVPIVDERVMGIVRRYNYTMPEYFHTDGTRKLNYQLKNIMHKLAESVPSLKETFRTILTAKEIRSEETYSEILKKRAKRQKLTENERKWLCKLSRYADEHNGRPLYMRDKKGNVLKYKYEMITSHTARRSAATNLDKLGVLDDRDIMSMTGHSSAKIFRHYIKTREEERAESIAEKMGKTKKVSLKKKEA